MADDTEDTPKPIDDLPPWILGAVALSALGAAWLGSKLFGSHNGGEMTEAKALQFIRDFNPLTSTPEQREQMARVMCFYTTQQRVRDGLPVTEYSKAVADLEAQTNWDLSSDGHRVLDASKRLLAMAASDLRAARADMVRQGINSAASEPTRTVCPQCRGLLRVQVRNFYGEIQSLPCPRCGATGFVLVGG